ncbi:MAG: cytidyltransferase [Chloroflexi bacterium]|nr:MAG: cytidyltransferase [Chloroflexota bacterium]
MGRSALSCVTGRFQPVHRQHLELFLEALALSERLIVAITNPDPGTREARGESAHRHLPEANPFTYYERLRLVRAALAGAGVAEASVDVVPFPIHHPEVWPHYVPLGTAHLVRVYSAWEEAKARELEAAGYPVRVLAGDERTRLSGSEVRRALREGGPWRAMLPEGVVPIVERLIAERPLAERTT